MKDVKMLVMTRYDFKNDKGEQIRGNKVVVSHNGRSIDISSKNETLFKCDLLTPYVCDLIVNDNLKIDVTNIRK